MLTLLTVSTLRCKLHITTEIITYLSLSSTLRNNSSISKIPLYKCHMSTCLTAVNCKQSPLITIFHKNQPFLFHYIPATVNALMSKELKYQIMI